MGQIDFCEFKDSLGFIVISYQEGEVMGVRGDRDIRSPEEAGELDLARINKI